ncbi:hypothetical protein GI374_15690 [Paracoccus sp. S-4012]|uniref:squalene/phytoene synthase family protein n=1 Tax=Paracoccus sp. S-4012 TaxID=2665648 RepID=UPI0012B0185B|nr:squalene/phytoene synthase family protein [Paracoccus sp. S-4012]MRX51835.1 hypothetical protein [Paracoccus sp. S-4012]
MTDWAAGFAAAEPDRAAALTLLPVRPRLRMLALLALGHELDRAARASAEPMLNEIRLQWWVEAVGRLPQGAAQHPLLGVLAEHWPGEGERLSTLVEGWRLRCDPARPGSAEAVMAAVDATAAALAWFGATRLGAEVEAPVRAQGRALGAAAVLAQLPPVLAPEVAAMGRAGAAAAAAQARLVPRSAAPLLYAGPLVGRRLTGSPPPSEFARRAALLRFAVTRDWRISLPR